MNEVVGLATGRLGPAGKPLSWGFSSALEHVLPSDGELTAYSTAERYELGVSYQVEAAVAEHAHAHGLISRGDYEAVLTQRFVDIEQQARVNEIIGEHTASAWGAMDDLRTRKLDSP
jgi:hypothetical protein